MAPSFLVLVGVAATQYARFLRPGHCAGVIVSGVDLTSRALTASPTHNVAATDFVPAHKT